MGCLVSPYAGENPEGDELSDINNVRSRWSFSKNAVPVNGHDLPLRRAGKIK